MVTLKIIDKEFNEIIQNISLETAFITIVGYCLEHMIDEPKVSDMANIAPIKEKWIEECEKYGIPSHKENEPIPFWDDGGNSLSIAFDEFYRTIENE